MTEIDYVEYLMWSGTANEGKNSLVAFLNLTDGSLYWRFVYDNELHKSIERMGDKYLVFGGIYYLGSFDYPMIKIAKISDGSQIWAAAQ